MLLFKVADPIRRYLRDRPDTIRCIVANLVGDDSDSPDSLLDDTLDPATGGAGTSAGGSGGGAGSQLLVNPPTLVDDYSDPNWDPEPIDAGPEFRANKPGDVLSTLVSIYDSQDLFVKELQVLLAQRLLSIPISTDPTSSNETVERIEKERRNIEILKLRFGESALGVCEVMLRDMTDSRRIDTHVQSIQQSVVHPTIISHHFWPTLESSSLTMPGQFASLQQTYSNHFSQFKPDKKLKFLPHLGTITLELELKDRKMEVTVPPLEAAFIELFAEREVWRLEELMEGVGGVDKGSALKALLTWIDYGVVEECEGEEGVFRLIEVVKEKSGDGGTLRQGTLSCMTFILVLG